MIKKFYIFALLIGFTFPLVAQDDTSMSSDMKEEMTREDQNKKWAMGEYKYSAKPKHAWELGIHLGHFMVAGDVPTKSFPSGFGIGLHLRKAINYMFSYRIDGMYYTTKGLDGRFSSPAVLNLDNSTFSPPSGFGSAPRNFQASGISGSAEILFNVGNILFHSERNKWNFHVGAGIALTTASVNMDYLNGSSPYNWDNERSITPDDPNSGERRSAIWDKLDGDFETEAENDRQVPFFSDNGNLIPSFVGSIGISRKLSERLNISLEHKIFIQNYDKWDGHEYRSTQDLSNDSDGAHYTSVRLAINLGDLSKKSEPLYWLNPLDAAFNDIAELKKRPALDLTDDDGDGIINMLDQELDSPSGCPVDTRGIALDSDGDGILDCKDEEPYSPVGYDVDEKGVAKVEMPYVTEGDVNDIVDAKTAAMMSSIKSEWFLPMIHFDLDKYSIKPEFYGHLHHVANVLKMYPDLCVTVYGHTDIRHGNDYNNVLSFNRAQAAIDYLVANYGLQRSSFKLMYGGEDKPLADQSRTEAQHYMNRRVEFRVCQPGDTDMSRPAGPDAGQGDKPYSGNKNSGY